ncbi:dnaJ homolog subfamily C member 16 [Leptidea sinapis]|uniref:dnaJ homolog subfamily C member 16 n=1 Tax=Leptidea sinapis TaxID=189913 RepID=UPI00213DB2E8|nr:dnaJ homolog subfamily C member 16 [Leptidea sinapis]
MQWLYRVWKGRWLCVLVMIVLCPLILSQKIGDPYKILGIHRRASLPEIRKAYKQLAKEWHPDKNEDPNAETHFVEIKQAYELLSDTERRQAYDLYGITNEDDHMYKQRHDYSQYARFSNDPYDFFSAHFRTQDQDITFLHKLSVTTRHFEKHIVEQSVHTPALVLFYSDWCFECVRVAGAWRKLAAALRPLGVTTATVHAAHEPGLARRLAVPALPALLYVIDRQTYIYKDSLSSLPNILEYMRWKFPYRMIYSLSDSNQELFLNDFEDNKVKALVFEERQTIRLRYLITAFRYREWLSFAFVDLTSRDTQKLAERFKVQRNTDTMILLKEDSTEPAATVSTADIPTQTLHDLIEANQLLTLPRLSSQSVLERVCPLEWRAARRRLCCVVVARSAHALGELRALARRAPPRLRYAYVAPHGQPHFLAALAGAADTPLEHRVVVLWRREPGRVHFEWLNETWPSCGPGDPSHGERLNRTTRALHRLVTRLLHPDEVLAYEAHVQELVDEAAASAAWRAFLKVCEWGERGLLALRTTHALSAASVLATGALVLAVGYLMAYLIRVEEEAVQRQKEERRRGAGGPAPAGSGPAPCGPAQPEMRLHELRAEKYNGLVRLQKPGCRTIVLLLDGQSRSQLLTRFHRIVWPYRKNKTLVFAFLCVDRHVQWFSRVLSQSLGTAGGGGATGAPLRVNARNCVGTVLALNPHRKYFCIYHPKHPEGAQPHKRTSRMRRSLGAARDPEVGAFIGFTSEADSSSEDERRPSEPLLLENLLDGLENWLDRLFEGSTHRYHVNYWPDMAPK